MNDFVERLPWQLAALAGLLVGIVSAASGTDLWVCLLRVGAAFALFFVLGMALRAVLRPGSAKFAARPKPASPRPQPAESPPPAAEPGRDEIDR